MWDEEVNAAARAATEGGVPHDFRSRVLARIDARTRRSAWKPIVLSSAIAAALVLVLAILIVSNRERGNSGASQEAASNSAAPGTIQPSPAASSESTHSARVEIPVARVDLSSDLPPLARDASAIADLAVPLLAPQEQIVNDPLTTDRLVTESIAIDALELPPLDGQAVSQ